MIQIKNKFIIYHLLEKRVLTDRDFNNLENKGKLGKRFIKDLLDNNFFDLELRNK